MVAQLVPVGRDDQVRSMPIGEAGIAVFELSDQDIGWHTLGLSTPFGLVAEHDIELVGESSEVTWRCKDLHEVEVVVRDVDGVPLPGARVALRGVGSAGTAEVVTSASGTAMFRPLPPALHARLIAESEGHEAVRADPFSLQAHERVSRHELRLDRTCTLRVRVTHADGRPAVRCGVEVTAQRYRAERETDRDGECVFDGLPRGDAFVKALPLVGARAYASADVRRHPSADRSDLVELVVGDGYVYEGVAVWDDGEPYDADDLMIRPTDVPADVDASEKVRVAADGSFEAGPLTSARAIVVEGGDPTFEHEISAGSQDRIVLTRRRLGEAAVRFVHADRSPARGRGVVDYECRGEGRSAKVSGRRITLDDDGVAVFQTFSTCRSIRVAARLSGYLPVSFDALVDDHDTSVSPIEVVVRPAWRTRVVVTGADGPVKRGRVVLSWDRRPGMLQDLPSPSNEGHVATSGAVRATTSLSLGEDGTVDVPAVYTAQDGLEARVIADGFYVADFSLVAGETHYVQLDRPAEVIGR